MFLKYISLPTSLKGYLSQKLKFYHRLRWPWGLSGSNYFSFLCSILGCGLFPPNLCSQNDLTMALFNFQHFVSITQHFLSSDQHLCSSFKTNLYIHFVRKHEQKCPMMESNCREGETTSWNWMRANVQRFWEQKFSRSLLQTNLKQINCYLPCPW